MAFLESGASNRVLAASNSGSWCIQLKMVILLATVVVGDGREQHWKLVHPIEDMYGYLSVNSCCQQHWRLAHPIGAK
jgi:hypothetical protein